MGLMRIRPASAKPLERHRNKKRPQLSIIVKLATIVSLGGLPGSEYLAVLSPSIGALIPTWIADARRKVGQGGS
jgi:hypothetical protein